MQFRALSISVFLAFFAVSCITQKKSKPTDSEKESDDGTAQTPGDTTGAYLAARVDCKIFPQTQQNAQSIGCLLVDPKGQRMDALAQKVSPLYRSNYFAKADVKNLAKVRTHNKKPLFHYVITVKHEYLKPAYRLNGMSLAGDARLQQGVNEMTFGMRGDHLAPKIFTDQMVTLSQRSPLNNELPDWKIAQNPIPENVYIDQEATYGDIGMDPTINNQNNGAYYDYSDYGVQYSNYDYPEGNYSPSTYEYPSGFENGNSPTSVEGMPPANEVDYGGEGGGGEGY